MNLQSVAQKYVKFHGTIVPMATPLDEQRKYDPAGMRKMVDFCLGQGAHGLFVMGSTGEALLFSASERMRITQDLVELVGGRVPVYVGVTALDLDTMRTLGEHAALCGADACVSLPHVFFSPLGRQETVDYFGALAASLPLPLIMYNLGPTRCDEQTILAVMGLDNIAGVKEATGDRPMLRRLAHAEPFVSGTRRLLAGVEIGLVDVLRWPGVHGCIPAASNIAPGLFGRVCDLCRAGNFEEAAKLQPTIDRLNGLYQAEGYSWTGIKGVKAALEVLGICGDQTQFPFDRWGRAEKERLAAGLAELNLLPPRD